MCEYVNQNWMEKHAIHLSAYVLWRLNWIHPFTDGNGRTARAASYVVLCARLGLRLPGSNTIPDQISADKTPYYTALEAADEAAEQGRIDVSRLEGHLESLLARQLVRVMEAATGRSSSGMASGLIGPVVPAEGKDT
jgi:Fic family protein